MPGYKFLYDPATDSALIQEIRPDSPNSHSLVWMRPRIKSIRYWTVFAVSSPSYASCSQCLPVGLHLDSTTRGCCRWHLQGLFCMLLSRFLALGLAVARASTLTALSISALGLCLALESSARSPSLDCPMFPEGLE